MGKTSKSSPTQSKSSNKVTQTVGIQTSIENIPFVMSTSILSSIEKLKGRENFSSWKFSIENYLELEDLSNCLSGTETDAKKNTRAKAALVLSVDKTIYVHIKTAKSAKEIWEKLKATFEDQGAVRKCNLVEKMVNTRLDDCESMEMYVSEKIGAAHKLSEIGLEVGDEWLALFLLCGLNEDYYPMKVAIENSVPKLTSDLVKTKLLQETDTQQSGDKAFLVKNRSRFQRKGTLICYTCRQKGHKSTQCPEKSKNSGNNKDNKSDKNAKDKGKGQVAFSAVFLSGKFDDNDWYVDSGCTRHMTKNKHWVHETKNRNHEPIRAANNEQMEVECIGSVDFCAEIHGDRTEVRIHDVLCVPKLLTNLLSVSELTKKGKIVTFSSTGCVITDSEGIVLATASLIDGLYRLNGMHGTALAAIGSNDSLELWHRRLAHLNHSDLMKMKNGAVTGISFVDSKNDNACVACCKGKQSRKPFGNSGSRATQLLEIIHADLAGKMETTSIGGSKYCLVLVDDFSRRTFVYMLKHKNEVFDKFCAFKKFVENQTEKRIKIFRSDNGTEFCSKKFSSYFERHGIQHQTSIPYTPQQNGLAERTIRTLVEKARCMLQDANLPKKYWAEAMNTAAYIKNHTTSHVLENKTPIEIWSGKKPDVSHFKVFGSVAMAMVPKEKRRKFDAKSRELMFVGYCEDQKGYRLMDRKSNEITSSRDVTIIESGNIVSNSDLSNNSLDSIADIETYESASESDDELNKTIVEQNSPQTSSNGVQHGLNNADGQNDNQAGVRHGQNNVVADSNVTAHDVTSDFESTLDNDSLYIPGDHEISEAEQGRRSARETKQPERFQAGAFAFAMYEGTPINNEPVTVKQAMEACDHREWKAAMDEEFQSLMSNQTWQLVNLPDGQKCITNKWVFKLKTDALGKVIRHKARLVARGCSQREGIDYLETFSPVVRYSSIRLLMAMAVKYHLRIEQMDVVTAFLHGDVKETIYMKQPENYDDGTGRVCKLLKSLYGLKQASRNWNIKLNEVLVKAGYLRCKSDACIYVRRFNNSMVIVAVYVDDLLIFSNDNAWKDQLKSTLSKNFKMKDLGNASNVLGIRINYDHRNGVIKLDQRGYTEAVLHRFNMFFCDPVKLPKDPNQRLTNEMSPTNAEEFRKMENVPYQEAVGSILYLQQCTRPDISFGIAVVSQFNQQPGTAHWAAVKRILRYLKGTLNSKLIFARNSKYDELCCYSDSDWGSSFCDYKSCSGYVTLWQSGAVSWKSKKQSIVALSTAEAEYIALSAACQETIWLKQLKEEILGKSAKPIEVFCDNKGAKDLCDNGNFSAKTKHINIRHHFIRDLVENETIKISKMSTELMVADSLTKGVPIAKHDFCAKEMGLIFE